MSGRWDNAADVAGLVDRAILDEPAFLLTEGGIVRDGWNAELDDLRSVSRSGKGFIAQLEKRERERTGIGSLKVRYNKVFGYYIEVTKPNLAQVPADYMRKQTLVNSERFLTPELKEYEEKVLHAEERIGVLEHRLFLEVRETRGQGDPAPAEDRRRRRRARRPAGPGRVRRPPRLRPPGRSTTATPCASRPAATRSSRRARPSPSSPTTSRSTPARTRS